jgi:hypothetical protein
VREVGAYRPLLFHSALLTTMQHHHRRSKVHLSASLVMMPRQDRQNMYAFYLLVYICRRRAS